MSKNGHKHASRRLLWGERRTELGRAVEGDHRHPYEPPVRRHLKEPSPVPGWVCVTEALDCLARDAYRAPEVRIEHRTRLRVPRRFELAAVAEARVVQDDVDAPERARGRSKGGGHLVWVRDIQGQDEEAI